MPPPRLVALRFAAFYAAIFLALGVYLPFWPLWLAHRGLDADEIGLLLALTAWVKTLALPPVARLSDRSGRPKAALCLLAAASLLVFAGFPMAEGFRAILAVQLLAALAFHALIPLGESQSLAAARSGHMDYGRVRLWGSLAFILGALGAGRILDAGSPAAVPWLVLGGLAATLLACAGLPSTGPPASRPGAKTRVVTLLTDRALVWAILCASLLQASHAVYYGFSALAWRAAGHGEAVVGWLWAEGVLAEVAFFALSATALRRLGPARLLAIAGLAGVLRWTALAFSADLTVLIMVQALHALTFGATHLAAVQYIAGRAPAGLAATAQGLYGAISGGAVMGLTTLLAGWLYQDLGARSFLAMTALSALGLGTALVLDRLDRHRDHAKGKTDTT